MNGFIFVPATPDAETPDTANERQWGVIAPSQSEAERLVEEENLGDMRLYDSGDRVLLRLQNAGLNDFEIRHMA